MNLDEKCRTIYVCLKVLPTYFTCELAHTGFLVHFDSYRALMVAEKAGEDDRKSALLRQNISYGFIKMVEDAYTLLLDWCAT
jgi:hypothetical protein